MHIFLSNLHTKPHNDKAKTGFEKCLQMYIIQKTEILYLHTCGKFNWLDMIWKGTHTSLYTVPQLTVHVRAKTKPWDQRNCPYSSETGLCRGTDLRKGTKHILQHWRSPRTQWPQSLLNGISLEPARLFLELAARPNWAIGGEGPWSGRWPRTQWSLWQSSRVPLWRWENLPEGQPSLQHSTNQ